MEDSVLQIAACDHFEVDDAEAVLHVLWIIEHSELFQLCQFINSSTLK